MHASPLDAVPLPKTPGRHVRPRRWRFLWAAAPLVLFLLSLALLAGDSEPLAMDDRARRQLPGRFVALSDGYTNYEVLGPERGPCRPAGSRNLHPQRRLRAYDRTARPGRLPRRHVRSLRTRLLGSPESPVPTRLSSIGRSTTCCAPCESRTLSTWSAWRPGDCRPCSTRNSMPRG